MRLASPPMARERGSLSWDHGGLGSGYTGAHACVSVTARDTSRGL